MDNSFSRYDVYTTVGSVYCYPGTNVLKNRLGIRDADTLKETEVEIYSLRQNALLSHPVDGRFSPNHLCRIHKFLFGDVYYFAGHFRREDILKGKTRFLSYEKIDEELKLLHSELQKENCLKGLVHEQFVDWAAYYLAGLNYIHPFREGNGRATREFMRTLFLLSGYQIDWGKVHREQLLDAMELSIYEYTYLKPILDQCLMKQ